MARRVIGALGARLPVRVDREVERARVGEALEALAGEAARGRRGSGRGRRSSRRRAPRGAVAPRASAASPSATSAMTSPGLLAAPAARGLEGALHVLLCELIHHVLEAARVGRDAIAVLLGAALGAATAILDVAAIARGRLRAGRLARGGSARGGGGGEAAASPPCDSKLDSPCAR